MLDIKLIRESPEIVEANLRKRGLEGLIHEVQDAVRIDKERREIIAKLDQMRGERNKATQEIARRKAEGKEAGELAKAVKDLPAKIEDLELKVKSLDERSKAIFYKLPNLLHESVPVGKGEDDNVEVRKWGKPAKPDFKPAGHEEIALGLGGLDLERAAKISGARFYFLKGPLVVLHHALLRFALDFIAERGYTPIQPPYMMRREPYEGATDLADFENVMYRIMKEDLYLIATAEHPVGAMYWNETLEEKDLPMRMAGISPCFRTEAGAHGKDSKGIFRVHQFEKVEQFALCRPEQSWDIHEEMIRNAENVFQALEMPYRVVNVCTGDIGTMAAKKYDLEAWMPTQGKYREMVSCSNYLDFSARRLGIKWRHVPGKPPAGFVHTLNSTAVATPRAIAALLENFQQPDGSVRIPKALQPYTGFKEISPRKSAK
jgi:seryl-tRNA synthetase